MKNALKLFESQLAPAELDLLNGLDSPIKIQAFLNTISYSIDHFYRCPLRVLHERIGHCFDGALFAAAALRRIGYPPLILEIIPNAHDDDHLLALFKRDGHWGAVAKSNFAGLRYREPIYRTVREVVMSYFEDFYNVAREKTLRSYTVPLNLKTFDKLDWMTRDETMDVIAEKLSAIRKVTVVTPKMAARLQPVDKRSFEAGLMGSNAAGLFKPK